MHTIECELCLCVTGQSLTCAAIGMKDRRVISSAEVPADGRERKVGELADDCVPLTGFIAFAAQINRIAIGKVSRRGRFQSTSYELVLRGKLPADKPGAIQIRGSGSLYPRRREIDRGLKRPSREWAPRAALLCRRRYRRPTCVRSGPRGSR